MQASHVGALLIGHEWVLPWLATAYQIVQCWGRKNEGSGGVQGLCSWCRGRRSRGCQESRSLLRRQGQWRQRHWQGCKREQLLHAS